MFFKSTRFKISIWYVIFITITLILFSLLVYHRFSLSLYNNLDDALVLKAGEITESINASWEIEKLKTANAGIAPDLLSNINIINFIKVVQRWANEESSDPKLVNVFVEIFNANGGHITSSKNLPVKMTTDRGVLFCALRGKRHFENLAIELSAGKPSPLRVLSFPVMENNKVEYVIRVAVSCDAIWSVLTDLKIILFLCLPLIIFLAGLGGMYFAKITLRPLDNIIKGIEKVKRDNFRSRINVADTKDEIKKLADAINSLFEEVDKSSSSESQFIQDASQELKAFLTNLKEKIELALRQSYSVKEYQSTLRNSLEEIVKTDRAIEDLLFLLRYDTKQILVNMRKTDLNKLIQALLKNIELLKKERNIEIDFSSQDSILVEGDEDQLKRLFLNLLDNAVEYTPYNGKIVILLKKEARLAKIVIKDTGIGIPKEEMPYIFDKFYRVDKSSRSIGLGLTIAKAIAEAHKGTIAVESIVSQGSSFIVSLPLSFSGR